MGRFNGASRVAHWPDRGGPVAGAPFMHEDPMDMADQMMQNLGIVDPLPQEDASLGEGDDDAMEDGRKVAAVKVKKTSTGCRDALSPAICRSKSILCDDRARQDILGLQCARTCGLCKQIKKSMKSKACFDGTAYCMNYSKKCHLNLVSSICPKTCGSCSQ